MVEQVSEMKYNAFQGLNRFASVSLITEQTDNVMSQQDNSNCKVQV